MTQARSPRQYTGVRPTNPPNVIYADRAPSATDKAYVDGDLWLNQTGAASYQYNGGGVWIAFGTGTTGAINTLTGGSGGAISPSAGNLSVLGTANQLTSTGSAGGHSITFSIPSAFTAPGSIASTTTITAATGLTVSAGGAAITGTTNINTTGASITTIGTGGTGATRIGNATGNTAITGSATATTTLTATLGAITATNGNVVLGTAGNKLIIATGSNASVGVSGTMAGTPGVVTVATTACSASAKVFYARATVGGTPGQVSITAQDGTGFTLTSTGNETSTFNWWIINA